MIKKEYYKIANELNETNFFEIANKYSVSHSELLGIIDKTLFKFDSKMKRKKLERLLRRYQYIKNYMERKYLILGDTHFGSAKQNYSYVYLAYDYAIMQSVERAFLLGDLLEGCTGRNYKTRERKLEKIQADCLAQIESLKSYPKLIPTDILLGNHDVSFFDLGIDLDQELEQNYGFSVLGYGGVYVKCHYRKIYMEHFIKSLPYLKNNFAYDLKIRGHSHCFRYVKSKNEFTVSSLSDLHDNKNCKEPSFPGFAILTIHNRSMKIEGFSVEEGIVRKCLKLDI